MAKITKRPVGRPKGPVRTSIFQFEETTQSKKVVLTSDLSRTSVDAAASYRAATGAAAVDIYGFSKPSKTLRNNIADWALYRFGARQEKAELLVLMNINSTMANKLKSPKTTFDEVIAILDRLIISKRMLNTNITIKEFIVTSHTAAEFGSNSITREVDDDYFEEFYDIDLQKQLAAAFNTLR